MSRIKGRTVVSPLRLEGKTAVVTGAASGIGEAIAVRLAQEGATVGLVDVDHTGLRAVQEKIADGGGRAWVFRTDVRKQGDVDRMARRVFDRLLRVDCLVNNAGIYPRTPFLDISEREWDQVLDTNLKGPFLCTQAICRQMVKARIQGRIVNIGSTASVLGRPGIAHYASSKAGLNMLTRILALELAPHGILVNTVCPGLVATARVMRMAEPADHKRKVAVVPLQREGRPDEIAKVVCFLLSDEAAYCTGGLFFVDGGYTAGLTAYGGQTSGSHPRNRGNSRKVDKG